MNTIILYATKYGATREIAERIAAQIDQATLHDLGSGPAPALSTYDCVVLGSPVTAGTVRKEVKAFAARHAQELKAKRLGIFVSGLQAEGEEEYLSQNFSADLLDAASAKAFLGGVFDPQKCGFLARAAIKAIAKLDRYTSTIDEEKIRQFAAELTT